MRLLAQPSFPLGVPLIAQIRVVFTFFQTKKTPLPVPFGVPLLFVILFEVFSGPDDVTKMYKVWCKVFHGPDGCLHHEAVVIPITAVTHAVELIPIYGLQHNHQATANVSLETYNEFYLNNYSNKEWYHTISQEYL